MLTVHHLGKSQSERIVWLCEELGIDYDLKHYVRDRVTIFAPEDLKALHPIGTAPVITDGEVLLAESGAVVEYVIARHGGGRLARSAGDADYVDYLYWFHFSNGSFQPLMGRNMLLGRLRLPEENPVLASTRARLVNALKAVDARLGAVPFFAGEALTAADIMMVFSLTTMRYFMPLELGPYPSILAYLARIGARPAYQRAMAKGDPGMALLLT